MATIDIKEDTSASVNDGNKRIAPKAVYSYKREGKNEVKVAIYCRLSEEDRFKENEDDDSNSIANQKAMLCQYALERKWKIFRIYSDDDYSGASVKRPEFQELLRDAEDRCFNTILCKTQARFSRDAEIVEKYLHRLFPMWGIRFIGTADNADTDNKGNKKSRQINALVNEWYLEDLSNNVRAGLTVMRQQGKHIGGRALYGYVIDPADRHHLIIDEEAAAVVRRIFKMYISGTGKQQICTTLNREGILSPSAYKTGKGIKTYGRGGKVSEIWKCPTVNYILTNEMYIGNLVQNRHSIVSYKVPKMRQLPPEEWIIVPGTHEAVVDIETWNMAQKLQVARARQGKAGTLSLFAGFVVCKSCGYKAATNKNNGKRYLMCPTRRLNKESCEGFYISQQALERIILAELKKMMSLYFDEDTVKRNMVLKQEHMDEDTLIRKKENLLREKQNFEKAKTDAYLDKVKGVLSEENFSVIVSDINGREMSIKKKLGSLEEEIRTFQRSKKERKSKEEILLKYCGVSTLNRGIITALINHIEIGKRTDGRGDPPVIIYWNF